MNGFRVGDIIVGTKRSPGFRVITKVVDDRNLLTQLVSSLAEAKALSEEAKAQK